MIGRARQLSSLPSALYELAVTYMPGELGFALRERFYRKRVKAMGDNVRFDVGVQLVNPQHMTFGTNIWIDKYVVLMAGATEAGGRVMKRKPNPNFHHEDGELVIGDYIHIASHVVINAHGGVSLGTYSSVASGARIYSLSHHYRNPNDPSDTKLYHFSPLVAPEDQALIAGPVAIADNAAIASNAVVLAGVSIGQDAWVGVGALVLKDVAPGMIVSGNPARPVNARPGYALPE